MDVERLKELINQREAIDAEIVATVGVSPLKVRKELHCSKCGSAEHTARTCPQKGA